MLMANQLSERGEGTPIKRTHWRNEKQTDGFDTRPLWNNIYV